MESIAHKNNSICKLVSRAEVIDAIKNSSNELRLLGTVAFNLPWTDKIDGNKNMYDILLEKYMSKNSEYEISILFESDPLLQSYALTSGMDHKGSGIPIAYLEEIRQNSTLKLREKFIQKNAKCIEPVEDTYRQKLDSLFSKRFASNICKELVVRGHEFDTFFGNTINESEENILGVFYEECLQMAKTAFRKSKLANHYFNNEDYYNLGENKRSFFELVKSKTEESFALSDDASQEEKINSLFSFCDNGLEIIFTDCNSQDNSGFTCEIAIDSKKMHTICVDCILKILEKYEQDNYEIIKEYASKEAYKERKSCQYSFENDKEKKQRLIIKQIFHPIPVQMLKVDGVYYAAVLPLLKTDNIQYLYLGDATKTNDKDTDRFSRFFDFEHYFHTYLNSQYCTEETKKNNRKEVIYNYTSNHAIIGQMPRDSFYGSGNYKLVMWALVFDRKGRILIHRRENNAKDNQGLWDKSVGGHIAIMDRDTIAGAAREIAIELYKVEEEEQSHTRNDKWNDVKIDEIIYLGKWKETRYPNFGSSLNLEANEFYLFSFESRMTEQPIDSMRVLPDGTRIKAKCFVDLYFTITSKNFDLTELKNSKFLVLPPQLIKRCATTKQLTQEIRDEIQLHNPNVDLNDISNHFDVTPDLEYIINSPEWDSEITKFSLRVKEAFAE